MLEPGIISEEECISDDDVTSTHSETGKRSQEKFGSQNNLPVVIFPPDREPKKTNVTSQDAFTALVAMCSRIHTEENMESDRISLPDVPCYHSGKIASTPVSPKAIASSSIHTPVDDHQVMIDTGHELLETILSLRNRSSQLSPSLVASRKRTGSMSQTDDVEHSSKRSRQVSSPQEEYRRNGICIDATQFSENLLPVENEPSQNKNKDRIYVDSCQDQDVKCHLGPGGNEHYGNTFMIRNVLLLKEEYTDSSTRRHKDKTELARRVMRMQNGRFLDKDQHGRWHVAEEKKALTKIKQSLRDSHAPKWAFDRGVCGWKCVHRPTGRSFLLQKRVHSQWIGTKWSELESATHKNNDGKKKLPRWTEHVPGFFRSDAWADVETSWYLQGPDELNYAFQSYVEGQRAK
jgi:hypothetical protein